MEHPAKVRGREQTGDAHEHADHHADFCKRHRGDKSRGKKHERGHEEHRKNIDNHANADDDHKERDEKRVRKTCDDELGAAAHGSQHRFFIQHDKKFRVGKEEREHEADHHGEDENGEERLERAGAKVPEHKSRLGEKRNHRKTFDEEVIFQEGKKGEHAE